MVAQVTFRSDNVFTDRFGRELADTPRSATRSTCGSVSRSSATSNITARSWPSASTPTAIWRSRKAMDLHDVARGSGTSIRDGSGHRADAGGRHLERHVVSRLPAASDRRAADAAGGDAPTTSRSTRRTATTRS